MQLWKMGVPTEWVNPHTHKVQPVSTKHHKAWDKKILDITGGITILGKIHGKWKNTKTNDLYFDNQIEATVACDRDMLDSIISITKKHYNQQAVMIYKVSDEVIIK